MNDFETRWAGDEQSQARLTPDRFRTLLGACTALGKSDTFTRSESYIYVLNSTRPRRADLRQPGVDFGQLQRRGCDWPVGAGLSQPDC